MSAKAIPSLTVSDRKNFVYRTALADKTFEGTHCWCWTGQHSDGGYGLFSLKSQIYKAHRISMKLYRPDVELDSIQVIDHRCGNSWCVNPIHLEQVPQLVNLQRRTGYWKTHCNHGHRYTEENTYTYPDGRRRCVTCRRESERK